MKMELQGILQHDLVILRAMRRERNYRYRMNPLAFSDEHLLKYNGFPRQELVHWCERLEPLVGPVTNDPVLCLAICRF